MMRGLPKTVILPNVDAVLMLAFGIGRLYMVQKIEGFGRN